MSKETDEFFRRGVKYGFRAGYYSAINEMQDRLNSAQAYDKNEKRVVREAYHMKDIQFYDGENMLYGYSERRIKNEKSTSKHKTEEVK